MALTLGGTTYASVVWTSGDLITEAKMDNMVGNDQAYDSHASNGLLVNNNIGYWCKDSGGTNQPCIGINSSDNTVIGENELRPTRTVYNSQTTAKVSLSNSSDVSWTDVDVTAETSARAYMVQITVEIEDTGAAATRASITVRKKGETDVDQYQWTFAHPANSRPTQQTKWVGLDTDQIFQYQADASGVNTLTTKIRILAYKEWLD